MNSFSKILYVFAVTILILNGASELLTGTSGGFDVTVKKVSSSQLLSLAGPLLLNKSLHTKVLSTRARFDLLILESSACCYAWIYSVRMIYWTTRFLSKPQTFLGRLINQQHHEQFTSNSLF